MVIGAIILIAGIIGYVWVSGFDDMNENHPDYKGEDFLGEDNKNVRNKKIK